MDYTVEGDHDHDHDQDNRHRRGLPYSPSFLDLAPNPADSTTLHTSATTSTSSLKHGTYQPPDLDLNHDHHHPSTSALPATQSSTTTHTIHHHPPFARTLLNSPDGPPPPIPTSQWRQSALSTSHHTSVNTRPPSRLQQPQQRNSSYQPPDLYDDDDTDDDDRHGTKHLQYQNALDPADSDDGSVSPSIMIEMEPFAKNELHDNHQLPHPTELPDNAESKSRNIDTGNRKGNISLRPGTGSVSHTATDASSRNQGAYNAKHRAQRIWTSQKNLDVFLKRIYEYYTSKGLTCIVLARSTNLIIAAFIVGFSTFLFHCVDHSLVPKSRRLSDVLKDQCMSRLPVFTTMFLFVFVVWWCWTLFRVIFEIPALLEMQQFFTHVLEITEGDLQHIHWQDVVPRITRLRSLPGFNPAHIPAIEKLDAHTLANRIFRIDNHMIAMYNKDILDLSVPFPIPLPYVGRRQFSTKIMEWNLNYCIWTWAFDERGVIRKRFLRDVNRAQLINELKRRFHYAALFNIVVGPFLFIFMMMHYFFRYTAEYQKNPGTLAARSFTPFAMWKMREFNEPPHLLQERLNHSFKTAMKYMSSFPKEHVIICARFVAFIAGSFAAVLAVLALLDEDFLLEFQITQGQTVLFYIGVFGGVAAVARGMVPEETQVVAPEPLFREVVEFTHYLPSDWRGKLHTEEVRNEFGVLFEYKIVLFLHEILSVVFAPLILFFSLPGCAEGIVDFFREFTVSVDALGHVCSFAVFDFKRHGNIKYGAPSQTSNEYYMSKEGKMEQSFLNFKANNPDWEPNTDGSLFIANVMSRRNDIPSASMAGGMTPADTLSFPRPTSNGGAAGGGRPPFGPAVPTALNLQHDILGHSAVGINRVYGSPAKLRRPPHVKFDPRPLLQHQPTHTIPVSQLHGAPHPLHQQPSPHLFSPSSGYSAVGMSQYTSQSMLASEMSDGNNWNNNPALGLFALLDAVYEANRTLY
ncbi:hypothetical protein SeMB42_g00331 [Synchytrium endobioticum]|uniref:Autophagy-related protein 9 n=1 Tax=Synchytrium endobioticum TaxID=286115 RepID=A0A507DB13_9FUNG|nr:hypothetical protein SeLEV6574_g01866 [Synchytrium endobioticum]TPX54370.1 hypothetical protein SeMB42_g00331 [Synchytrium endobioticum]